MADGEILDADAGGHLVMQDAVEDCRSDVEPHDLDEFHDRPSALAAPYLEQAGFDINPDVPIGVMFQYRIGRHVQRFANSCQCLKPSANPIDIV